eukprot:6490741-Amphidinium_carterae.1
MGESNRLFDTRILSKPRAWKGEQQDWRRFKFQLTSYVQAVTPELARKMEQAETLDDVITRDRLGAEDIPLDMHLHTLLAVLLEERALDRLMAFPGGHGFEAWRTFCRENEPKTVGHLRSRFVALLVPEIAGEYETRLAKWETQAREYEALGGEPLTETMKMGVFQASLCPKELREHLTLHAHRLETYEQMKEEVRRVRLTRAAIHGTGGGAASSTDGTTPMDVDALTKGKDKGRKGDGKKGDGKKGDGKKGKGKAKQPQRFEGECRWCGRKGHMEKDCYYKKEYERKSGGKGGEKPAPVSSLEEAGAGEEQYVMSLEEYEQVSTVSAQVADRTRALIDSGAAVNACPLSYVESRGEHVENKYEKSFVTANGEFMRGHGASSLREAVSGTTSEWPVKVTYETMPVNKLIWSVTRAVDNGWAVWFTGTSAGMCPGQRFSFEVDGEHVPFERRAGVYEARLRDERLEKESPACGYEVMPLETGGAAGSSGSMPAPASTGAAAAAATTASETAARPLVPRGLEVAAERAYRELQAKKVIARDTLDAEMAGDHQAKVPRAPTGPSDEERTRHWASHCPFRSWCDVCVKGKAKDRAHERQWEKPAGAKPVIQFDYAFPSNRHGEHIIILTMVDSNTGSPAAIYARAKGPGDEYVVRSCLSFLDQLGYSSLVLRCDPEPACVDLARTIKERRSQETVLERSPRGSKGSLGVAEATHYSIESQIRTMRLAVEIRYPIEVTPGHVLAPWLVKHAAFLLDVCQLKPDGRTSFERRTGKPYKHELYEFSECLLYKVTSEKRGKMEPRWEVGLYVGRVTGSHEAVLLTPDGVARAHALRRQEQARQFELEFLSACKGSPWNPSGKENGEALLAGPSYASKREKRLYITRAMMEEHGATPGCKACRERTGPHTASCRTRFERLYGFRLPGEEPPPAPVDDDRKPMGEAGKDDDRKPMGDAVMDDAAGSSARPEESEAVSTDPLEERRGEKRPAESERAGEEELDAPPEDDTVRGWKRGATSAPEEQQEAKRRQEDGDIVYMLMALTAGRATEEIAAEYDLLSDYVGDLEHDQVREGRADEVRRLEHFDVKTEIDSHSYYGPVIPTRWVDVQKEPQRVRSRVVGQQFKTETDDEFFAATPDMACFRLLLSDLARSRGRVGVTVDAVSAFLQAVSEEEYVVRPPRSLQKEGKLWMLKKALPGLRKSSRLWQEHQAGFITTEFHRSLVEPCMYVHKKRDVKMESHGDDLFATGDAEGIEWFRTWIKEQCECNVGKVIGLGPDCVREGRFLKRRFWVDERGWHHEADAKHIENLLVRAGLTEAKGMETPGSQTVSEFQGADTALSAADHAEFRHRAGVLQYLASDRVDARYAIKELMREASNPTLASQARVKRVLRYFVRYPRLVYDYAFCEETPGMSQGCEELNIWVDSDHASNPDRKSTSGLIAELRGHVIYEASSTQGVIALSSGEAEFYALVRGVVVGLHLKHLLEEMQVKDLRIVLWSDSVAGRGMISRLGVGKKAKHIDVQYLFAQQYVRDKVVEVRGCRGVDNISDLCTKHVARPVLQKLLGLLPVRLLTLAGAVQAATAATTTTTPPTQDSHEWEPYSLLAIGVTMALWGLSFLLERARPTGVQPSEVRQTEERAVQTAVQDGEPEAEPEGMLPKSVFITLHGRCYHTQRDCFGLRGARTTQQREVCRFCLGR